MINTTTLLIILTVLVALRVVQSVKWTRVRQISVFHLILASVLLWTVRCAKKGLQNKIITTVAVLAIVYHGLRLLPRSSSVLNE